MKSKSFWVIGSGALSMDDLSTVTLLYQPIIGSDAYGIYQTFIHFLDCKTYQSDIYQVRFLMDLLNLKEKELIEAINKLEAIGLLSTYIKDDLYMYRLSLPLSPRQFFLDGILGSFLRSEIGNENFKILFNRYAFKEVSREGYTNVTKTFDQVYQVNFPSKLDTNAFILDRKNGKGVIINTDFDFESFYKLLPVRLQKKRLFTKRIISQIASIHFVYGLNSDQLIDVLSEAYDESHASLFYERIGLYATQYFEKNQSALEIEIKQESLDRPILSEFTPQEIIQTYAPKMTNLSFALQTIRQFVERNAVDIGVINAVIIICLRIKEDLPNLTYLEKVLNTLLQKGITTETLAYEYIMKEEPKRKPTYSKQIVERFVPEWMDEFEALLEE
ncbi:replication initiation and membrane attachment protein [Acholeplasma morum]|uniref:DnaD domain protein n=1 Tax=Paracholeplasma morum TaxID=264637 RepID=UPI00195D2FD6|nr:DnaD domain protein [Paracholeplasma morum]MBM7453466.1 replication initiation and membrane attachment protein [Paracholeplasma morum]